MVNEKYSISFVVPLYNNKKTLIQCIESININKNDGEIILIDDCSSDGSDGICHKLCSEREGVRYIRLNDNYGPGYSRGIGLKEAKGEYVFFLDADDTMEKEQSDTWLSICKSDTKPDIIVFKQQLKNIGFYDDLDGIVDVDLLLQRGGNILATSLWNYVFRKSFLDENNIAFSSERICEDYSFVSKALIKAHSIFCLNGIGYHYNKYNDTSIALSSNEEIKIRGGNTFISVLNDLLTDELSEIKKNALKDGIAEGELLMFTIPVTEKETDLWDLQKKFMLDIDAQLLDRKLYLTPACDMSIEVMNIVEKHGLNISGFADNSIIHNQNVRKLKNKGFDIKRIDDLDNEMDYAVICHRSYLTSIIEKQLTRNGFIEQCDFMSLFSFLKGVRREKV